MKKKHCKMCHDYGYDCSDEYHLCCMQADYEKQEFKEE